MTKFKREASFWKKVQASASAKKEVFMVNGEDQLLKIDLVILATGSGGDEKLEDIFVSPHL